MDLHYARRATCILSLLLLALQAGLYYNRSPWVVTTKLNDGAPVPAAPAAAAAAAGTSSNLAAQALLGEVDGRRDYTTLKEQIGRLNETSAILASGSSGTPPKASTESGKDCGQKSGEFPRNRILIVHEQHLQSMGCDVRLLRFVKDLIYLNQEVSMFFRGSTPATMRQPKSKQLASILKIQDFEEEQLRKGLRDPPGLYEWTSAERFGQLMAKGYFNVVIIFLWFWYDPQPSVAELVLPLMRAHSPPDKQPFVALLSDDAHALRSYRLGEVEIHPSTRDGYNDRARNYWLRQKNMYRLTDMVMYISAMDQVAEKESYPFIKYFRLLRMPIRAFRILSKSMPAPMQDRTFLRTGNIGFIGNGLTPTNHLGIQWYLEHCWEDVKRQLPDARMRLIGSPPGERTLKGQQVPCVKREDAHCGWAWGTSYSGYEAQHGIDELGYLSAEGLLEEVLSWRLMIVPVLRTTGVNTKILVALELGVPLVITPVAASPFDFQDNETVVAFASQAADFVQQTVAVYTISWLWTHLSRESRRHWENLASHDPARADVRNLISTVCQGTDSEHFNAKWEPPLIANEPPHPIVNVAPCVKANATPASPAASSLCPLPPRAKSVCFKGGNFSGDTLPLVLIAAHGANQVFPKFAEFMVAIWQGVCKHCGLTCAQRREGGPYDLQDQVDILIDLHWSLPLVKLSNVSHRLVYYYWDSGKMGRYFHFAGNLLDMVGANARFIAEGNARPASSILFRINQEMRNAGGFIYSWRKALQHLGMSKPGINKIIAQQVDRFVNNWTVSLAAHMKAFKSG